MATVYVITLIFFKNKTIFKDTIDNEYVLDIGLGVAIFVIVILVLLVNKGISKAVDTQVGSLDTIFGFSLDC